MSDRSDFFKSLLLDSTEIEEGFMAGDQVALFVQATVFEKFKQCQAFKCNEPCYDIELNTNEECFDMKLIYVTLESYEKLQFLQKFIENGQFSFPWENRQTVFCDLNDFNLIEEFIRLHNLKRGKIEEKLGITFNGRLTKTVTFENIEIDVIEKYGKFISKQSNRPQYFYISYAFPWLQPNKIKHFMIPINIDEINSVLPIVLDHLATFEYLNGLDIFDLLNLKLALCDPRCSGPTNRLKYEIDCIVRRSIKQMSRNQTYIRDRHFDLLQYAFDRNFAPGEMFHLIPYFKYEFQNYFESVENLGKMVTEYIGATVNLIDKDDVFRKLNKKPNINFTVNGISFDRINTSLFHDLLAYNNVTKIILDTNFRFAKSIEVNHHHIQFNRRKEIHLIGSNDFKFCEKLLTSIKTLKNLSNAKKYLSLTITGCRIVNYLCFNDLVALQVIFRELHINNAILKDLSQCTLKMSYIRFEKCTLENTIDNWMILNEIPQIQHAVIYEDDDTWQCLYDFILYCLNSSGTDHFKFNRLVTIISNGKQKHLHLIKFTIDKLNLKLQLEEDVDYDNGGQVIDLFDLKNRVQYDSKCDFEFYQ